MNPVPRIDFDSHSSGQPASYSGCTHDADGIVRGDRCRQFEPPCPQDTGWYSQPPRQGSVDIEGECRRARPPAIPTRAVHAVSIDRLVRSGDWTGGRIVDEVVIPATLAPGDWILGWRWDCEESTQVWASCADVTIVAPSPRA
jgi:hypothetical protein